jgi:hypothetical protein
VTAGKAGNSPCLLTKKYKRRFVCFLYCNNIAGIKTIIRCDPVGKEGFVHYDYSLTCYWLATSVTYFVCGRFCHRIKRS